MWVKAFDMLLEKMKSENVPFEKIAAVSGSGQQHGSVYWKIGAQHLLNNLNPESSMHSQLKDVFSVGDSPIWMDASTTQLCRDLEEKVGGKQRLTDITGSCGYERMTGNQIAKIYQTNREAYLNTERISLVSSFVASLCVGDYAPIDESDGSGMNLLNIHTREWAAECLTACAPDLADKLGSVVPSKQIIGSVSPYLVQRYGFAQDCQVIAFTGDNPASLAGLTPSAGDVMVSLGTSDTIFLWLSSPKPSTVGHVFVNPIESTDFMALACFKNGSLTRERIRNECAEGSWDKFIAALENTPMGNNGNIGIYFYVTEIQPLVQGVFRFNSHGEEVTSFPKEVEIRAVLEGQMVARRYYSEMLGFNFNSTNTRVIATGGASTNPAILQVIADVFNAPVYTKDVANSAALGSAFRAKHGWLGPGVDYSEVVSGLKQPPCVAVPSPGADKVYGDLCDRYKELEARIQNRTSLISTD
ncbi:xylulose kinase-like isoform X2 [Gigantopelta aegis]|nr:xylulose kinase-like isoform X2 [Gigantopelta aegis]